MLCFLIYGVFANANKNFYFEFLKLMNMVVPWIIAMVKPFPVFYNFFFFLRVFALNENECKIILDETWGASRFKKYNKSTVVVYFRAMFSFEFFILIYLYEFNYVNDLRYI